MHSRCSFVMFSFNNRSITAGLFFNRFVDIKKSRSHWGFASMFLILYFFSVSLALKDRIFAGVLYGLPVGYALSLKCCLVFIKKKRIITAGVMLSVFQTFG